jgi:NADPH:quinone reductase-like Zn-dependent oxidoreductase
MVAVQLARQLGAEVFGTASPSKWPALRALGLDEAHLSSSRTLEFEQRVLAATGGEGVDVVLSALTREYTDASLRCLRRGGRFIEIGKADVRDPAAIESEHGAFYRAFELMEAGPERLQSILLELSAAL